jgi:hypothetical protein
MKKIHRPTIKAAGTMIRIWRQKPASGRPRTTVATSGEVREQAPVIAGA